MQKRPTSTLDVEPCISSTRLFTFASKPSDKKQAERVAVQTVAVNAIGGMNKKAVRNVQAGLTAASRTFAREAKQCGAASQRHPWNSQLDFEKNQLPEKYVSVVFAKSTVCVRTPDIEKEAPVFSHATGKSVSARSLFRQKLSCCENHQRRIQQ
ncbi:hypothetical protein CR152_20005 [Massilia violaceinigra]|uniref:Uncharacterized protein n=1 Tax=Massilia violaceinigra TaxID=2045208 RepID=A0A2D2DNI7_9BURK|nr:hypothetical protein [Massilia violaceinigra]ATQ76542.1 hypothetical protein CR152_20005 [Massilia violaceinigra]